MKINWKLRLQNRVTLTAIVTGCIGLVYEVLSMFEIVPTVDKSAIVGVAMTVINLLVLVGVVVDPTTQGVSDGRALDYIAPGLENAGGEGDYHTEAEQEENDPEDVEVK